MTYRAVDRLVRSAYLDDAEPEAVSQTVRQVLEKRGALVSEHRHSRVKFSGLRPGPFSWSRAGYVGIYQPLGEREAEVRLQLRARWPWRILLTVAAINVLIALIVIATNPPGTTWSVAAIITGLALVAAAALYVGTLKDVRDEERALMSDLDAAFASMPEVAVETAEERELRELEAALEGEITQRKIDASRPPKAPREKGKRFALGPKKKEPEESADEKRARLLARKAELEAKRAQRGEKPPGEQ